MQNTDEALLRLPNFDESGFIVRYYAIWVRALDEKRCVGCLDFNEERFFVLSEQKTAHVETSKRLL